MSTSITIGKIVTEDEGRGPFQRVTWPDYIKEQDGTSLECTLYSGEPERHFSAFQFHDWIKGNKTAAAMYRLCNTNNAFTFCVKITPDLQDCVNKVTGRSKIDKDRATWLKYWTARAVQEFGDEAGIGFSS